MLKRNMKHVLKRYICDKCELNWSRFLWNPRADAHRIIVSESLLQVPICPQRRTARHLTQNAISNAQYPGVM